MQNTTDAFSICFISAFSVVFWSVLSNWEYTTLRKRTSNTTRLLIPTNSCNASWWGIYYSWICVVWMPTDVIMRSSCWSCVSTMYEQYKLAFVSVLKHKITIRFGNYCRFTHFRKVRILSECHLHSAWVSGKWKSWTWWKLYVMGNWAFQTFLLPSTAYSFTVSSEWVSTFLTAN